MSLLFIGSIAAYAADNGLIQTEVMILEQSDRANDFEGGSSSSIGTDAFDVKTQTTWFYGEKAISTCYQRLDSFPRSSSEVSKAIENSIRIWRAYFKDKKI